MKKKIVTITAGHSDGKDKGAVTTKDGVLITESDIVVKFRNALASYFHKHTDVHVRVDGYGKTNLPLNEAIKLIKGSDVALEIHTNSFSNASANGVECIGLAKHKELCQKLSKAISDVFGSRLRGDKGYIRQEDSARGKLAYVQNNGIIVELFFLSNKQELQAFEEKYWLAAKAMYLVLCEYLGITPIT